MESLGEQLRAARTAMNKSLDDVSNDTNISKQYLEALEEDNYSIFPARVYAKGFLGIYAKYVGLDPNAVTDQYRKLTMLGKFPKDDSEEIVKKPKTRQSTLKRLVIIIIIALVVIFVALYFWSQKDQSTQNLIPKITR